MNGTGRALAAASRPRLVPELAVGDLASSLAFWCDLMGFRVLYDRPEERFAFLHLDGAEVMLEGCDPVGAPKPSDPFVPPLGSGSNLQITVDDLEPMLARLEAAAWPLVRPPETRWYRAGDVEVGQRQFVVADPDGYLLRPARRLGLRPL